MNTHYKDNLKAVMQVNKNYTDTQIAQAKEEIYWHIGEYSVTTSDDNRSASVKTVPANATRCKIKRVYGNTQKLNPTTVSDSTSASVKTMPSTVYDFDVSKVEGASYKINQLVSDEADYTNTVNEVTITLQNGKYTLSGTATDNIYNIVSRKTISLKANHKYLLVIENQGTAQSNSTWQIYLSNLITAYTVTTRILDITSDGDLYINCAVYNNANVNCSFYQEVIDLTAMGIDTSDVATATTELLKRGIDINEYQAYDVGSIRNFAWTGVKVEGANLFNPSGLPTSLNSGGTKLGNNFTLKAGTYAVKVEFVSGVAPNTVQLKYANGTGIFDEAVSNRVMSTTFTLSSDSELYFGCWNSSSAGATSIQIMLNLGSTALPYADYITPTTLPIDLSTILYNGNPLFEENALKGVGTAKDYITPYKAYKVVMREKLKNLNWGKVADNVYQCSVSATPKQDDANGKPMTNSLISTNYARVSTYAVTYDNMLDKAYVIGSTYYGVARFYIKDSDYADVTSFKNHFTDNDYIYYELATPIEVSINWASTLRGITGYSNGTITLLNTNNMDSANTITYNSIIKENCCAKIVQSRGGSVVKTINLPTVASDGYSAGSVSNVRDFTTGKRGTNVDKNILGDDTWEVLYGGTANEMVVSYDISTDVAKPSVSTDVANILTTDFTTASVSDVYTHQQDNITAIGTTGTIAIYSSLLIGYSASVIKTSLADKPLYYELADDSKTETDITAIDNVIEVQPSDILSFYDSNDNAVNVPSDLTYRIEVAN